MTDFWQGRLLVATPALTDDPFWRTVVMLVQHSDEDGAVGVVLNRPTGTGLEEVLPGWALLSPDPTVVFEGGPVEQTSALCLGRVSADAAALTGEGFAVVAGAPWLATVDLDVDASSAVQEVRVFAGYAGWSPGQLEGEVADGAWWVVDALPGDPFVSAPERLWAQVLRRQGPPLALVATHPTDPRLN